MKFILELNIVQVYLNTWLVIYLGSHYLEPSQQYPAPPTNTSRVRPNLSGPGPRGLHYRAQYNQGAPNYHFLRPPNSHRAPNIVQIKEGAPYVFSARTNTPTQPHVSPVKE